MYRLSKQEREFRESMRGRYQRDCRWYAIMTHCGSEHHIRERILFDFANDGVEQVWLPEMESDRKGNGKKRNGSELLFSCYVFLRCRMSDTLYVTVSAYDSVYGILGRAYRIPAAIEETEMTHLRGVLGSYPPPLLSPRLNIGAEAMVTRGLMEGLRGRIVEFNSHFVKMEARFSFFDDRTSILVSVPLSEIRLCEKAMFSSPRHA